MAARCLPIYSKAAIGPDKVGLAVGAIVLGLVLILVSGADMSPGPNRRAEGLPYGPRLGLALACQPCREGACLIQGWRRFGRR
jgi:hypothetical protein